MKLCVTVLAVVALVSVVVDGAAVRRRELKGGSSSSKSLKDKKDKSSKGKKEKMEKTTPSKPSGGGGSDCKDTEDDKAPAAATAPKVCLTKEGVNGIIKAFESTVVAISDSYWCRGDHAKETECGGPVADGPPNKAACERAYKIAHGAIDAAYGYADSVLFKPTLTTEPYTYRPTRNGALSYFIGTACVNLVALPTEQFPDGNGDGKLFQENGFAINAFMGSDKVQRTGWTKLEYDLDKFLYRIGGQNCETTVVQGKICFVHATTELGQTCVDKTFGFNDLDGDGKNPVITTHHSSATIKEEGSLVICQSVEGGTGKVPKC